MRFYDVAVIALLLGACLHSAARAETAVDGKVRLYIKAVDPDGGRLNFLWTQISGPAAKIGEPAAGKLESGKYVSETFFLPTETGKYVFQVSVKNERGDESRKMITRDVLMKDGVAAPPPANGTVGVIVPDAAPLKPGENGTGLKPLAAPGAVPLNLGSWPFPEPWKRKCKP